MAPVIIYIYASLTAISSNRAPNIGANPKPIRWYSVDSAADAPALPPLHLSHVAYHLKKPRKAPAPTKVHVIAR